MPLSSVEEALAIIHHYQGNNKEQSANRVADEALEKFPDNEKLWAAKSNTCLGVGNHDSALEAAEKALALNPNSPEAHAAYAVYNVYIGDNETAAEHVANAETAQEPSLFTMLSIASYYSMSNPQKSLEIVLKLKEEQPDDIELIGQLVTYYGMLQDGPKCMEAMKELESKHPQSTRLLYLKARHLAQKHDLKGSVELLLKEVELNPEHAMAFGDLASRLYHIGRVNEAKKYALRALELNPRTPVALSALANVADHEGDKKLAEDYRQKSRDAIPALKITMLMGKANELLKAQKFQEAIETLEPVTLSAIKSMRINGLRMQSMHAKLGGLWDQMERCLKRLNEEGDRSPAFYIGHYQLAEGRGRKKEAASWIEEGIETWPANGELRAEHIRRLHASGVADSEVASVSAALNTEYGSPNEVLPVLMALDDCGHEEAYSALFARAKELFPGRQEWKMFEMLQMMKKGDFKGAMANAVGLKGDMKKIGDQVSKTSSFLDKLKGLFPKK